MTRGLLVAAIALSSSIGWHTATMLARQDRADRSIQAFRDVATVLSSPRCANCHISGDAPLQGPDGHVHTMNIKRGSDGRGLVATRCTNCHQDASSRVAHAPPGAPDWRLPPPATPMAWRGLSVGDQCRLLKDPARNGNRSLADLLDHAAHDPLVAASWKPGPGRALPPLSHEQFVERVQQWIDNGAACPH